MKCMTIVGSSLAIATLLVVGNIACADLIEQSARNSKPSGLTVGVARADISPPTGILHMNWGSATHIQAIGVDPLGLSTTAVVFSDGNRKFALVDVDISSFNKRTGIDTDVIVQRAAKLTGILKEHIRLTATHNHSGPLVRRVAGPVDADLSAYMAMYDRYVEHMSDKIVGVIAAANSTLQPAHMYGGRGQGTININRRFRARDGRQPAVGLNPDGFVDRELIVVRIDNAVGQPIAILTNYAMHGTDLGFENKIASPGWVGSLRKTVEDAFPGALCLFFQGAAGNLAPVEGYTGDLNVARRLGRILGHQVAAVAEQIETVAREPVFEGYVESAALQAKQYWRVKGPRDITMAFSSNVIEVPRRQYSEVEIDEMKDRAAKAAKQVESARGTGDQWAVHQASARYRRLSNLAAAWENASETSPISVEIQAMRIGDLAFLAMPGEPFAEIGYAIKENSPFAFTMFSGYTDGIGGGYMPVSAEYQYGGYEIEATPFGPGADKAMIRAGTELLNSLR